jgi:PAS domain S-box-containing protein
MRILIVDDREENLYLLETLLRGSGYAVVTARDGVEALDKLKEESIDMIVSDILMPNMDGFQLCRECKKDDSSKKIPFIFYTATYTDKKDEKFALSLGAEKYIVKPVDPQVFFKILEEVIEKHKKGVFVGPKEPIKEEGIYFAEYNKRLIQKLEKKILDLEESKQFAEYLYNVLKTVRNVNQLIVREKNRDVLLQKACDTLIKARGYSAAWLGFLKDEKTFAIVVGSPLKADISLFCKQVLRGDYPSCIKKAFIQKIPFMVVDQSRECGDCRLKNVHSGKKSVVIRIEHNHKLFGLLAIILAPDVYIDEEEKGLLEELAGDIAFGLHNIELEEKDKLAEQKLSGIIDSITEHMSMIDEHYNIVWANDVAKRLFRPDLIGKKCYNAYHRRDKVCGSCVVSKTFADGEIHEHETEVIGADGKKMVFWCTANVSARYKDGRPRLVVEISRDITDRKQAEERLKKIMDAAIDTMSKIIEAKDPYTSGHQHRVCQLAVPLARELGLSSDKVEGIRIASLIHDIGKIGLPTEILSKPTKLTDIESSLIKGHSQIGYDILKSIEFSYPIARIVLQHHERLNGSGYPNHLKGDKILLEARILGVADVVEAMSSHRPYRPALGIDKALEEITQNKGILYDPEVVDVCLKLFKEKGFKFE